MKESNSNYVLYPYSYQKITLRKLTIIFNKNTLILFFDMFYKFHSQRKKKVSCTVWKNILCTKDCRECTHKSSEYDKLWKNQSKMCLENFVRSLMDFQRSYSININSKDILLRKFCLVWKIILIRTWHEMTHKKYSMSSKLIYELFIIWV